MEEAYQLLDEIISRGVKPDIWSYNAIQAYHCDHCEVNRAFRLMFKMEKDNCLPDPYIMVLKLLISTYAVLIHGFCKKGKLEEAGKYFEMMIDEGIPSYITLKYWLIK